VTIPVLKKTTNIQNFSKTMDERKIEKTMSFAIYFKD
jgi:hypothetical protein